MRLPWWHGSHAFPRGCGFKPKRNESGNESDLSFAFFVRRHPLPRPVSSGQLLGCATENRRENRAGCAYPFEISFYDERSLLPRFVISLFAAGTTIVTIGLVEKRFTLLLQPFFYAFILFRFNVFHCAIFRYIHIRIYLFIHIYIGYLSPENLWVSSRCCSMFLDSNVSYFFYVPIVLKHRVIIYHIIICILFLSSRVILQ